MALNAKEIGGSVFSYPSLGSMPQTLSHREGHLQTFTPFPLPVKFQLQMAGVNTAMWLLLRVPRGA